MLQDSLDAAPDIRIAHGIIIQAIREHASEIHIEPSRGGLRLACTVYRRKHDVLSLPPSLIGPITMRVKSMAGLDPKPSRWSQEADFWVRFNGGNYHLMLISTPTSFGESITIRMPA